MPWSDLFSAAPPPRPDLVNPVVQQLTHEDIIRDAYHQALGLAQPQQVDPEAQGLHQLEREMTGAVPAPQRQQVQPVAPQNAAMSDTAQAQQWLRSHPGLTGNALVAAVRGLPPGLKYEILGQSRYATPQAPRFTDQEINSASAQGRWGRRGAKAASFGMGLTHGAASGATFGLSNYLLGNPEYNRNEAGYGMTGEIAGGLAGQAPYWAAGIGAVNAGIRGAALAAEGAGLAKNLGTAGKIGYKIAQAGKVGSKIGKAAQQVRNFEEAGRAAQGLKGFGLRSLYRAGEGAAIGVPLGVYESVAQKDANQLWKQPLLGAGMGVVLGGAGEGAAALVNKVRGARPMRPGPTTPSEYAEEPVQEQMDNPRTSSADDENFFVDEAPPVTDAPGEVPQLSDDLQSAVDQIPEEPVVAAPQQPVVSRRKLKAKAAPPVEVTPQQPPVIADELGPDERWFMGQKVKAHNPADRTVAGIEGDVGTDWTAGSPEQNPFWQTETGQQLRGWYDVMMRGKTKYAGKRRYEYQAMVNRAAKMAYDVAHSGEPIELPGVIDMPKAVTGKAAKPAAAPPVAPAIEQRTEPTADELEAMFEEAEQLRSQQQPITPATVKGKKTSGTMSDVEIVPRPKHSYQTAEFTADATLAEIDAAGGVIPKTERAKIPALFAAAARRGGDAPAILKQKLLDAYMPRGGGGEGPALSPGYADAPAFNPFDMTQQQQLPGLGAGLPDNPFGRSGPFGDGPAQYGRSTAGGGGRIPREPVTYTRLESDQAPTKTQRDYKLMRLLKSRPGELFPLYAKDKKLKDRQSFLIDNWYRAENQTPAIGGQDLANRPGIHAVNQPLFEQGKANRKGEQRIWIETEMPAMNEATQAEADALPLLPNGQRPGIRSRVINPDEAYEFKTNNAAVGATSWPIAGSARPVRVMNDVEVESMLRNRGLDQYVENSRTGIDPQMSQEITRQLHARKPATSNAAPGLPRLGGAVDDRAPFDPFSGEQWSPGAGDPTGDFFGRSGVGGRGVEMDAGRSTAGGGGRGGGGKPPTVEGEGPPPEPAHFPSGDELNVNEAPQEPRKFTQWLKDAVAGIKKQANFNLAQPVKAQNPEAYTAMHSIAASDAVAQQHLNKLAERMNALALSPREKVVWENATHADRLEVLIKAKEANGEEIPEQLQRAYDSAKAFRDENAAALSDPRMRQAMDLYKEYNNIVLAERMKDPGFRASENPEGTTFTHLKPIESLSDLITAMKRNHHIRVNDINYFIAEADAIKVPKGSGPETVLLKKKKDMILKILKDRTLTRAQRQELLDNIPDTVYLKDPESIGVINKQAASMKATGNAPAYNLSYEETLGRQFRQDYTNGKLRDLEKALRDRDMLFPYEEPTYKNDMTITRDGKEIKVKKGDKITDKDGNPLPSHATLGAPKSIGGIPITDAYKQLGTIELVDGERYITTKEIANAYHELKNNMQSSLRSGERTLRNITNPLVSAQLATPTEAPVHAVRMIDLATAVPANTGNKVMDAVAEAIPLGLGRTAAFAKQIAKAPSSLEYQEMRTFLDEHGVLKHAYKNMMEEEGKFSKAFNKYTGVGATRKFFLEDIAERAKVVYAMNMKRIFPEMNDADLLTAMQRFGNNTKHLQSSILRWSTKTNFLPFAGFESGSIPNAINTAVTGHTGYSGGGLGKQAKYRALNLWRIWSAPIIASLYSKAKYGQYPWELGLRPYEIPVEDNKGNVRGINLMVHMPMAERALKAIGMGSAEQPEFGSGEDMAEADKIPSNLVTGMMNVAGGVLGTSPLIRAGMTIGSGEAPYLSPSGRLLHNYPDSNMLQRIPLAAMDTNAPVGNTLRGAMGAAGIAEPVLGIDNHEAAMKIGETIGAKPQMFDPSLTGIYGSLPLLGLRTVNQNRYYNGE